MRMRRKILSDFKMQTDHLIPARRPSDNQQKKTKNLPNLDLAVPADHKGTLKEIKKEKKDLDFAREM